MKFVVEALGLKVGGGKQLALNLMTQLAENRRHEFLFLVPDLPDYVQLETTAARCIVFHPRFGLGGRNHLLNRTVIEICLRERANALLCLGNFPPRVVPCPTVVLLQNAWIVCRDHTAERRQTLREKLVVRYGRRLYRKLPARTCVITQTTVMRDHLHKAFGFDPRLVAVIPNAISFPEEPQASPLRLATNEAPRPFSFLCLARYYAHKNIEILLDAMEHLPRQTSKPARCLLTIAADQHPGAARLLRQLAARRLDDRVINLGPLSGKRLTEAYRGADALILPTLLESHSRTYLEAMHFSIPIATSDRDFARHACRDAALYFEPLDARAVAVAMARLMDKAALRHHLIRSGSKILSQSPSWEEIANRFTETLEQAARGEWNTAQDAAAADAPAHSEAV